jgi:hypothetical protein
LQIQPSLTSGVDIKTVAGYSIVGTGDQPLQLNDLSDVTVATPVAGQTLYYNGTQWINIGQTGAQGGGAAKRIWSANVPAFSGTTTIVPGTAAPAITAGTELWNVTISGKFKQCKLNFGVI